MSEHPSQRSTAPALSASEALISRERIRGATRMIPEGTDAAKVTDEQIQIVAVDVETFRKSFTPKISANEIARATGYSPGVISEFLAGRYGGNRGQVALDLENWLVEEESRRSRPATTQFVWTNVAMEVKAVANYCLDRKTIGLVYGPDTAGIGKTTALKAIQQELGHRRATLLTIDKVDANPTGLFRKVCSALRLNDEGTNRQRSERIVKELKGRNHLLLIDQIHNLRGSNGDKPFYNLCDLYEATKTAQLWCGTADLVAYLQRQQSRNADESLAQIRRRIFPCVDLMESIRGSDGGGEPLVTVDQVREMFARNKLKLTSTAARFLCEICNQPDSGGVGLAVQIVEYATMMAEIQRMPSIDLPLLKQAMRRGFSPARADVLLQRMEVEQSRVAKVG